MFYGYVESEALNNPTILNNYKPVKIDIEHVPTSQSHPYVHSYYLQFEDSKVELEAKKFARETKEEWYLLFWNDKTVYAIFTNKVIRLPNEINWHSEKYKETQRYGAAHGIEIVYMDFNKNFKRFKQVLARK